MNQAINAIASLSPETASLCRDMADFAFYWGGWFIWIALFFAVVETVAVIFIKLAELRAGKRGEGDAEKKKGVAGGIGPVLEAIKGILEALKGLPAWVAIFLAGLALLWMAGQRPDICKPPPTSPPPQSAN